MSQKETPGAATEAARAQSSVEPESTLTAAYLTSHLDALKGAIADLTEWKPCIHSNGSDCDGADAVAVAANAALERVGELAGEGLFAVMDAVVEQPMRHDMNKIPECLAELKARETEREAQIADLKARDAAREAEVAELRAELAEHRRYFGMVFPTLKGLHRAVRQLERIFGIAEEPERRPVLN